MIFGNNSTITIIEPWIIPFDILNIIFTGLAIIFALIFLFIIRFDKTCHTIPMMLVVNSYTVQLIYALDMLGISVFALQNDFKQIKFYDSLCLFTGYVTYVVTGIQMYSYLLQAIYRYITVVYRTYLFWQSGKFQFFLICLTWICDIIFFIPVVFTGQIIYHADDQICQISLGFSFLIIFTACYNYAIPMGGIILIYFKMVRYVQEINKNIIPANTLSRAKRELRMIRRITTLVFILLVLGMPYVLFLVMSFFNATPKYSMRIAYIFVNISLALVMIALYEISEPLKTFVMKKINRQPIRIIPTRT